MICHGFDGGGVRDACALLVRVRGQNGRLDPQRRSPRDHQFGTLGVGRACGARAGCLGVAHRERPVFVQAAPRWRVLFGPLNAARSDFPPNPRIFGSAAGGFSSARATTDPELVRQAIAVLRAYLEQAGAQLEHKPAERRLASAANGSGNGRLRMSREEALDVLGLEPTASAPEIADAHRRLGERVDPQVGGTHYLSMKIDEARDVLLGE